MRADTECPLPGPQATLGPSWVCVLGGHNQLNCHESGQCMLASNSGGGQRQLSGKDPEPKRELGISTWKAISPSLLYPITAACVL